MNFDLRKATVYLALSGSRAYGTFTDKSDYDFRGVCIPPLYNYVFDKFEQTVDKAENKHLYKHYQDLNIPENSEFQIMELSKFVNLGIINNPNVIEILFLNNIYLCHSVFQKLLNIRKSFLSKKCKKSFIGYALDQLHRAKKHRKYLEDPPKGPPLRKDFGLPDYTVIPRDQLGAAQSLIEKEIQNYSINQNFLPEETKVELENDFRKMMQAVWRGLHLEEYPIGYKKQYSSTEEVLSNLVIQEQQFSANFIEIIKKERAYRLAKHEYDCYLNWLRDRNPERAELEKKFGIDCYVEETEFLTDSGWKLYDQITKNDKLATLNEKTFKVEYQNFYERFESLFTGNLYHFFGDHYDAIVTPNHRMLAQKVERVSQKKYGFDKICADKLPDTFEFLRYPTPNNKNYCVKKFFTDVPIKSITYLNLMGWYLSDGCMHFKKNYPNDITISQKQNGKLYKNMISFFKKNKNIGCSFNEYARNPNSFNPHNHIEAKLRVYNKDIVNKIYKDCNSKSEKRIPRYIFSLSKRLMDILLTALIMGDGTTKRPDNGIIYYSKSRNLANDVQELAMMCGYETSLYGPYKGGSHGYEIDMFQVHINKTRNQFKQMTRAKNVKKEFVKNKRVVCFSVKNDNLVTRLKGNIAFHCNCKHMSHVVRLILTGKDIVTTGEVIVKRPEAEMIRKIRSGEALLDGTWSYEKFLDFTEKEIEELEKLMKNSSLPNEPDVNKIRKIVFDMILEFNGEK